jgi:hypothetical protein
VSVVVPVDASAAEDVVLLCTITTWAYQAVDRGIAWRA